METDRHASDGDERDEQPAVDGSLPGSPQSSPAEPPSTSSTDAPSDPPAGEAAAPGHADEGSRAYDYGEDPLEAAGDADTGTDAVAGEGSLTDTGLHPATGVRGTTAPRAVLRPVPGGFPTPPPRPAIPNRRPAPKQSPAEPPAPRRRLLIAGISLAAVLLLVVVVGGGILAARLLVPAASEESPAGASDQPTQAAPAAPSTLDVGEVRITALSTEVGLRGVGSSNHRIRPEGEFIAVTFAVENSSDVSVQIGEDVLLETADGTVAPHIAAGSAYESRSVHFGTVTPGETMEFHAVYDVPIGTSPTGLRFDITQGGGTLPLGG